MFFRRDKPKEITFDQRIEETRRAGFSADSSGGRVTVKRDGFAAVLDQGPAGEPRIAERAGIETSAGIATLVDGGFQKFFLAPNGLRKPALAADLKGLHAFQEDLREALGMKSLYNESLGTVSTQYLYDRVKDRDRGVPRRPWE